MARYVKTQWNTTTVFNPTNMNHIEQGIYDADLREGGIIDGDLRIDRPSTTTSVRYSNMILGNETAEGTVGNSQGRIRLCSNTTKYGDITADNLSSNRTYVLPDKSGTIALDIGVATGTTASSSDWSSYASLPSGFNASNCVIIGVQFESLSGVWRSGDGASGNQYRFFAEMSGSSVRVYNNDPSVYSKTFKITLHKYA